MPGLDEILNRAQGAAGPRREIQAPLVDPEIHSLLRKLAQPVGDPTTEVGSDMWISRRSKELIKQGLGGVHLYNRIGFEIQQMMKMKQMGIPPQMIPRLVQPP